MKSFLAALFAFASVAAADPITLQLNWKPEPQFGGFYAAEVGGAFKRAGLDVKISPGGVGTPTVQMVGAGKAEFGIVSADELVIARSQGNDVVALFAVYQTNPQAIMTPAARGITKLDDLFAQPGTLAMQKGLPYSTFLEKKFGFDKLKIVPSPGGDLTVLRSQADYAMQCFATSEPIQAKKLGLATSVFLIADSGYNPYTTVLVCRGQYLKDHADEVKKMTAAVREGWTYYLDDSRATNDTMHTLNPGMDIETLMAAENAQKALIETEASGANGLGSMTAERWQALITQLDEMKLLRGPAPKAEECFAKP